MQAQAAPSHRVEVGAAGDESDVFTGRGESCTDIAADAA